MQSFIHLLLTAYVRGGKAVTGGGVHCPLLVAFFRLL